MITQFHVEKNILGLELSGKLTDDDYKVFVPEIERALKKHKKLRLIVKLKDFDGWDLHALWDDIKFDMKHFFDFQKIALVGENKWQKWMSLICKPFTMAMVKYYDSKDIDKALIWVKEEPKHNAVEDLEVTPY